MRDTYQHNSRRKKVIYRRRVMVFILVLILLAAIVFGVVRYLIPALRGFGGSLSGETPPPTETETPPEPEEPGYDYSLPVAKSQEVTLKYFDDAVFIGNSRTQGLILYNAFSNCISYATKGLSLANIYTTEVTTRDGLTYPMLEALQYTECSKIYLMLGMNDMGWPDEATFGEKYADLIDAIRKAQPKATIYIQSVLPLTLAKEKAHPTDFTMERVNAYNKQLRALCVEKEVYYLDVASIMTGADGYLPDEAANDGVHLTPEYCKKWLAYLQNHVILPEDYQGEFDVYIPSTESDADSGTDSGETTHRPTSESTDVTDFTKS